MRDLDIGLRVDREEVGQGREGNLHHKATWQIHPPGGPPPGRAAPVPGSSPAPQSPIGLLRPGGTQNH
eukprot:4496371-Amphidinium_carterae.1